MSWVDADGHPVFPMLVRTGHGELIDGWKRKKGCWGRRCRLKGMFRARARYDQELGFEVCECGLAVGAHECR